MTCTKCNCKITEIDFMDDEGNLLCEDCYEEYFKEKKGEE